MSKLSAMQRYFTLWLVTLLLSVETVLAQYDQLNELKDHAVKVFYSAGQEQRAIAIIQRVDKAMAWYQQLLSFKPAVTLLVLSKADWSRYTDFPVYGMPHYNNDKTLVVAAEDNPYWKSFLPPLEQLPGILQEQIKTAYSREDGSLSMQAFFDLLALHELGHAFHIQARLTMQRKWLGELVPNILLHAYIAENEPVSLPALTVFPKMVIAGGTKEFTYTRLADLEERYEEIGKRHAKNYGWYQCRWHAAAASIYDANGMQVGRKIWNALKDQTIVLNDEQLADYLETKVSRTVANVLRNWEKDTVR